MRSPILFARLVPPLKVTALTISEFNALPPDSLETVVHERLAQFSPATISEASVV